MGRRIDRWQRIEVLAMTSEHVTSRSSPNAGAPALLCVFLLCPCPLALQNPFLTAPASPVLCWVLGVPGHWLTQARPGVRDSERQTEGEDAPGRRKR